MLASTSSNGLSTAMAFFIKSLRSLIHYSPWAQDGAEGLDGSPASSPTGSWHSAQESFENETPPGPLPTPRRLGPLTLPVGPKRFVDVLIEAVERNDVCKMVEIRVEELRADADSVQRRLDGAMAWRKALEGREIQEIQSALDESQAFRASLVSLMDDQWRDEQGRSYASGLKDLQACAEADLQQAVRGRQVALTQLYTNADEAMNSAMNSGQAGGLTLGWRFCGEFAKLKTCAKNLNDTEQRYNSLGPATAERAALNKASAELLAAKSAKDPARLSIASTQLGNAREVLSTAVRSKRDLKRDLDRRRKNQRLREDDFLEETAHPLLVAEGHLLPKLSPSLPPTPSSLERLNSSHNSEADEGSVQNGERASSYEDDAIKNWKDARRDLADCKDQHRDLLKYHAIILADHLAAYSRATPETAERDYEQRLGDTFTNLERDCSSELRDSRARYEVAKVAAVEAGVDMLPGSPAVFADMTTDGRSGSASSGWREAIEDSAPTFQRRVLRWSRSVAKGTSPRSPPTSPGWSPSSVDLTRPVDHDLKDDPSDAVLIAKHLGKLEDLRPVAEKRRREALAGPLRETRAQKRQRLGDNTSIQWQRTYPAQSSEAVAKERKVQRRAVRAGRDDRSVGSPPDGQDDNDDSSTNSEPRSGSVS